MSANDKVYELITEKMIEKLEAGVVPWRRPWNGGGAPMNAKSKREYNGMNVFLLGGHACPYWASMKQINELGGRVEKGEKSSLCVFWKQVAVGGKDKDDGGDEAPVKGKFVPMLRYYMVWNIEQTTLRDDPRFAVEAVEHDRIAEAEAIVVGMPDRPELRSVEPRAFYRPSEDMVNVPEMRYFTSAEGYYATMFHELGHSTGHVRRLAREGVMEKAAAFGSNVYSREELVAEMTAAFLCGKCGIEMEVIDNAAAYIAGWLHKLRDDRTLVVKAAGLAQRAADCVLGIKREWDKPAEDKKASVRPSRAKRPPAPPAAVVPPVVPPVVPFVSRVVESPEIAEPTDEQIAMEAERMMVEQEEKVARAMMGKAERAVWILVDKGFGVDVAVKAVAGRMGITAEELEEWINDK